MDRNALEQIAREFRIGLFETAISVGCDSTDALLELAQTYAECERHADRWAVYQEIVGRHPTNAGYQYDYARSCARIGSTDLAFEALHRALRAGFRDVKLLLESPDLASVRADARWAEILTLIASR